MTTTLEGRLRAAFAGHLVVVTGGSRGIGLAAAGVLAEAGARCVLIARDGVALEQRAADLREAAAGAAHRILTEHGTPALVLANAGHSIRRDARDSVGRAHDAQRTVAVNYTGHAALLLDMLPAMRSSGRGRVVVSSSVSLAVSSPGWAAYSASKAAMERWVRDIDAETRVDGVTLGVVRLPLVRTAMIAPTSGYANARALTAERAAEALLRAALSRRRRTQPWWAGPAGMATALAPGVADRLGRMWQRRLAAAQERA
jgi:short-subunit dehydrogenase